MKHIYFKCQKYCTQNVTLYNIIFYYKHTQEVESGEFKWTKFLWFAVEIPIWKTPHKRAGHLHHTLWGISLPLSPRRTREQLLSPRAFSRHTSILVQWALVRCTRTLSLWVHSRSVCPSWLGWAAKSEWMFASANPVCVIWGPIKATEGQRCEGLYQAKSSIDRAFSTILCLVMRLPVKQWSIHETVFVKETDRDRLEPQQDKERTIVMHTDAELWKRVQRFAEEYDLLLLKILEFSVM